MDPVSKEYRPSTELSAILSTVEKKTEEMAIDFLDELETKGIVNSSDYEEKQEIIAKTVKDYQSKFMRWLQAQ